MHPQVSEIGYHFMMKKRQATCMLIACPELDLVTNGIRWEKYYIMFGIFGMLR